MGTKRHYLFGLAVLAVTTLGGCISEAVYTCDTEYTNYSGTIRFENFSWQLPDGTYDNKSGPDQILAVTLNGSDATSYDALLASTEPKYLSGVYENQFAIEHTEPVELNFTATAGRLSYKIFVYENDVTKDTAERVCRWSEHFQLTGGLVLDEFELSCERTSHSASDEDIPITIGSIVVTVTATEYVEADIACGDHPDTPEAADDY